MRQLEDANKIVSATENYFGFPKHMFISRERPDISNLSADEISIVDSVAELICSEHTAKSISDETHDALWEETPFGDDVPIGAAAMIPGEITPEDLDWASTALGD